MTTTKETFVVADLCHLLSHKEWDKIGEAVDWDIEELAGTDVSIGRVIDLQSTANGDGAIRIGSKVIGVDSGTVAVIKLKEDVSVKDDFVTVDSIQKATEIFEKALTI